MAEPDVTITTLTPDDYAEHEAALAELLRDCVEAGASVHFIVPFSLEESLVFWREKVAPAVRAGHRDVVTAHVAGRLVGTVQLSCDTPPNSPHRADVSKLLVHPDFRRRGIARAMMAGLEDNARRRQRRLLLLDTAPGYTETFYREIDYQKVGVIPGFARDAIEDVYLDTVIMYKAL